MQRDGSNSAKARPNARVDDRREVFVVESFYQDRWNVCGICFGLVSAREQLAWRRKNFTAKARIVRYVPAPKKDKRRGKR